MPKNALKASIKTLLFSKKVPYAGTVGSAERRAHNNATPSNRAGNNKIERIAKFGTQIEDDYVN